MKKYRYLIVSMLVAPGMVLAQQPPGPGPMVRPAPGQPNRPGGPGGPGGGRPDRPGAGRPDRPNPGRPNPGRPERPTPLPSPVPGKPGRPPHHGNRPHPGRPEPGRPNPGRPNPGRPQPGRPNPGRPQPGRPQPGRPGRPGGGFHRPGEGRPPSFRPIHRPGFSYPHGYRYRRWSIGLLLPAIFLSSTYIYQNYWDVGVEAPPPGYYWVRYGPDLLLVQRGTRRIVDVIYGAFY